MEGLDDGWEHDGDDFESGRGDCDLSDEHACVEIMLRDHLGEGAHLFDPYGCFGAEFYPDYPDGWWGGVGV